MLVPVDVVGIDSYMVVSTTSVCRDYPYTGEMLTKSRKQLPISH
jgi:hypothetical protein